MRQCVAHHRRLCATARTLRFLIAVLPLGAGGTGVAAGFFLEDAVAAVDLADWDDISVLHTAAEIKRKGPRSDAQRKPLPRHGQSKRRTTFFFLSFLRRYSCLACARVLMLAWSSRAHGRWCHPCCARCCPGSVWCLLSWLQYSCSTGTSPNHLVFLHQGHPLQVRRTPPTYYRSHGLTLLIYRTSRGVLVGL